MEIEQFLIDRIHPDQLKRLDFGGFKNHKRRQKLPNGSVMIERFRRGVRAKDGMRCTNCGSTEGLEAHHIEPIEYINKSKIAPYQNHSIENGKLLCHRCHAREHNNMGA